MIERLNSTITSSLKACIDDQDDWPLCLQSICMSYRAQRHESTRKSPYEMIFGHPMRLPMELEELSDDDSSDEGNIEMGEEKPIKYRQVTLKEAFDAAERARKIIHDSAAADISRAMAKQAKYYNDRHKGQPLKEGDLILHYNSRAQQRKGNKLLPRWLGPYTIVKCFEDKQNYMVKDKYGRVLKKRVAASQCTLYLKPLDEYLEDDSPIDVTTQPEDTIHELEETLQNSKTSDSKSRQSRRQRNIALGEKIRNKSKELTPVKNTKRKGQEPDITICPREKIQKITPLKSKVNIGI